MLCKALSIDPDLECAKTNLAKECTQKQASAASQPGYRPRAISHGWVRTIAQYTIGHRRRSVPTAHLEYA